MIVDGNVHFEWIEVPGVSTLSGTVVDGAEVC